MKLKVLYWLTTLSALVLILGGFSAALYGIAQQKPLHGFTAFFGGILVMVLGGCLVFGSSKVESAILKNQPIEDSGQYKLPF